MPLRVLGMVLGLLLPAHAHARESNAVPANGLVRLAPGYSHISDPEPPGQPRHYAIEAPTDSVALSIQQLGLDYVVEIAFPDGSETRYDSPNGRGFTETILLPPVASGTIFVSIDSEEFTGTSGQHAVTVTTLSSATALERAALNATTEAGHRFAYATPESRTMAL
jgi:hypothetical protein